jgi:preprotein translocase subunit SecY
MSSVFSIIIVVAIVLFPFFTLIVLWKKNASLSEEKSIKTFGSLYNELRKDSRTALLYNVIYMIRRLVFALNAILL